MKRKQLNNKELLEAIRNELYQMIIGYRRYLMLINLYKKTFGEDKDIKFFSKVERQLYKIFKHE